MGRRREGVGVMIDKGKARRAVLALALVAGVVGFGAGSASSSSEPAGYAATVRGCGAYLAEDSAAHVRLVVFDRQADGSVRLVYGCVRKGW
jgi:hypothetical protein